MVFQPYADLNADGIAIIDRIRPLGLNLTPAHVRHCSVDPNERATLIRLALQNVLYFLTRDMTHDWSLAD